MATLLSGCIDIPKGRSPNQTVKRPTTYVPVRPEARQCLSQLSLTRANFTPLPDQYFGAGCSNLNTVRLAGLYGDTSPLAVTNLGPITCPLANTFAGWARFGADRAARQILGSPLVRIETMGTYNCRNVAGTARRSGHATADAIDISAFVLADGRRITLVNHWSGGTASERRFLRTVHESACKRFGMVLGPDYNSAHRDHFHLEEKTGSFCR
jgi:hypothetical protein